MLEREFERAGIPAVLITALLPTARAINVNRVVPGTGITNPVGNPRISPSEEKVVRRKIVAEALAMLTKDPRTL